MYQNLNNTFFEILIAEYKACLRDGWIKGELLEIYFRDMK